MFKGLKKIFKSIFTMSNWKRWFLLALSFIGAIIAMFFGSKFFIAKNINKSVEYGGGLQVVAKIERIKKDNFNNLATITSKEEENVANSLYERLTGGIGLNGTNVVSEGNNRIKITQNGTIDENQRRSFLELISTKPSFIMTDKNMRPLFLDGYFNADEKFDLYKLDEKEWSRFSAPIKPSGAELTYSNNQPAISVNLANKQAEAEFTKATEYVASLPNPLDRVLLFWNGLDELKKIAETKYNDQWIASGKNFFKFVHVDNDPEYKMGPNGQYEPPLLKSHSLNAKRYLISEAFVRSPLTGSSFVISSKNFTVTDAKQIVANMNYGSSDYKLTIMSSNWISPDLNAYSFRNAMIAGIVVFTLIIIFMIVSYGLLGVISSLSISLYMFLTLLIYSALGGEYSPAMIAALIIGIGISVDSNIITFERLKDEVYGGDIVKKSYVSANKLSLSSILDANITTIIVSFILFYFGNKTVKGFSITLIFSVILILAVMLLFTKLLSYWLINLNIFDNKLWLLGMNKKYIDTTKSRTTWYKSFNYVKNSKWFLFATSIFMLISILIFSIFAGINKNFFDGFNRSYAFKGGVDVLISASHDGKIDAELKDNIIDFINNNYLNWGFKPNSLTIKTLISEQNQNSFSINLLASKEYADIMPKAVDELSAQFGLLQITSDIISASDSKKIVLNTILAIFIAFVGIAIYTLIRFKWTYSLAILIGLIHILFTTIAFIIISRAQVSPIIIAAILSTLAFSINDAVVVFDRIKEIIRTKWADENLNKEQIKEIANQAIGDVIKRSAFTTLTTVISVVVLLCFVNATDMWFNIVMVFGLLIGSYTSLFISVWIWTAFETISQNKIKNKITKKYWKFEKQDEQVFRGINDFVGFE